MSSQTRRARRSKPTDVPVPAIPAGKGPFVVKEMPPGFGRASTPLAKENALYVPLGSDDASRAVRFHEYAHLELNKVRPTLTAELDKYVNRSKDPIDPQWLEAAKDVVVNAMASKRGLAEEIAALPLDDPTPGILDDQNKALWLLRKLSLTQGKVPRTNTLSKNETAHLSQVYNELTNLGANYSHELRRINDAQYAKHIADRIQGLQSYYDAKAAMGKVKLGPAMEPLTNEMLRKIMEGEKVPKDYLKMILGREDKKWEWKQTHLGPSMGHHPTKEGGAQWGKMEIKTQTMDARAKRKAPERQPSYVGGFRNAFRALLPAMDGRAWAIKRKKMGGTILLDMSGSMSLSIKDIQKLLALAPLGTIAGYAGDTSKGWLWIMAKGGRYSSKLPDHPGGNTVDGPALAWLAKQPKPRVWISDGEIVGASSSQAASLYADAIGTVARGHIDRYHTIKAYLLGNAPEGYDRESILGE